MGWEESICRTSSTPLSSSNCQITIPNFSFFQIPLLKTSYCRTCSDYDFYHVYLVTATTRIWWYSKSTDRTDGSWRRPGGGSRRGWRRTGGDSRRKRRGRGWRPPGRRRPRARGPARMGGIACQAAAAGRGPACAGPPLQAASAAGMRCGRPCGAGPLRIREIGDIPLTNVSGKMLRSHRKKYPMTDPSSYHILLWMHPKQRN